MDQDPEVPLDVLRFKSVQISIYLHKTFWLFPIERSPQNSFFFFKGMRFERWCSVIYSALIYTQFLFSYKRPFRYTGTLILVQILYVWSILAGLLLNLDGSTECVQDSVVRLSLVNQQMSQTLQGSKKCFFSVCSLGPPRCRTCFRHHWFSCLDVYDPHFLFRAQMWHFKCSVSGCSLVSVCLYVTFYDRNNVQSLKNRKKMSTKIWQLQF